MGLCFVLLYFVHTKPCYGSAILVDSDSYGAASAVVLAGPIAVVSVASAVGVVDGGERGIVMVLVAREGWCQGRSGVCSGGTGRGTAAG